MKEIKPISADIEQRFNTDISSYMNDISDFVEYDMLRYDRTLDAEEETDEH